MFLKRPSPFLYCLARKKKDTPQTRPNRTPLIEPAIMVVLSGAAADAKVVVILIELVGVLVVVLVAVADSVADEEPTAEVEALADDEADKVAAAVADPVAVLDLVALGEGSGPNRDKYMPPLA